MIIEHFYAIAQEHIIPYLRVDCRKQNGKYERPFKLLTKKNNFE